LGSSRALLEMIQHNNATHPHTKLSALPENVSGSSDDSDVENGCAQRPSTSKRAAATARRVSNGTNNAASASVFSGPSTAAGSSSGAAAERSGRQRALSSSSTESGGTYIADTPSAIFHASSSALVMRHVPDRDR
uniref:Pecanex-like protein n=2 Tax=Anisakis simplex TaxID=6269 RepID=A0A0M3JKI0_ANISI